MNQPERISVANQGTRFPGAEAIAASPRIIAFVDIPPGTRFLPQAAELNDGQVVTFFSPLVEKLKRDRGTVVEDVIGAGGRPRWIEYRVFFASGETVHLDVSARADYDTGTFAYYVIRRGERHGLRIMASLKSEPALNLLAAYDK